MAIIKLKNEGDEATLDIVKAESVAGEYGQQVRFDIKGGDTLYVPESSVLRQLDRCKVADISELSGRTIHFFRAPNSKKGGSPFWNIDAARPEDVRTPPSNGNTKTAPKPYVQEEVGSLPNDDSAYADSLVKGNYNPHADPEVTPVSIALRQTEIREAHGRAFAYVCKEYVPIAAKAGVELSLEGVSALTFQLFKAQEDVR